MALLAANERSVGGLCMLAKRLAGCWTCSEVSRALESASWKTWVEVGVRRAEVGHRCLLKTCG